MRIRQLLDAGCQQQEIADAVGESRHVIFRLSKMAPAAYSDEGEHPFRRKLNSDSNRR